MLLAAVGARHSDVRWRYSHAYCRVLPGYVFITFMVRPHSYRMLIADHAIIRPGFFTDITVVLRNDRCI